jgi:predicted  nucleic acid-binding Zn-ribbon protein
MTGEERLRGLGAREPTAGQRLPTAAPASADGRRALEALLELQDLDTAISQLEHRKATIPERQQLAGVVAALRTAEARAAQVEVSRAALAERQRTLESDIAVAVARREALEARMYAARGAPPRELQAMDDEIRHLRARQDELEDAELEVMVALEPLDAERGALEAERAALEAEAARLRAALTGAEAEIDAELSKQRAARAEAADDVPEDLLRRYESLRARLGGTGAARLVGNRCSGCHLELPSMEVDRIRHLPPGTVVTCEQCGRILVPTSSSAADSSSADSSSAD